MIHSRLRLRIGDSGTAVLEFALVAPILVSLLLGVSDLAPSLMVRFKIGNATQAVADLAAQAATMQAADITNFFAIGSDVMTPFAGAPLIQRITNVASDGKGHAFVYWSCGEGALTPYYAGQWLAPPTGLLTTSSSGTDTSYIMVESQYSYTAPAGFLLKSAQLITTTAYTLPRVSTYVGPVTGIPGYDPPTKPSAVKYSYAQFVGNVTCNIAL